MKSIRAAVMIITQQYLSGSSLVTGTVTMVHPWHTVTLLTSGPEKEPYQSPQLHSICTNNLITVSLYCHVLPNSLHTPDLILPNVLKQQLYLFFFLFQLSNWIHKIRHPQSQVLLNFKTKIFCNSVDNYGLPILFNLYKIWNLLISVKLCRQRNTFVCCIPSYCGILKHISAVVCHFKLKDSS